MKLFRSDFWIRIKRAFSFNEAPSCSSFGFPNVPNAERYKNLNEREAYIQGYKEGYLQGMLKQQSLYQ